MDITDQVEFFSDPEDGKQWLLGPVIYNQAISDMQIFMQEKLMNRLAC